VLECLGTEFIDMADLGRIKGSHWSKVNQGMVSIFRHRKTGAMIVVANCHLHFNSAIDYVRHAQMVYLLERIGHFVSTWTDSLQLTSKPCLILCGDLNSGPQSSVLTILQGETFDPSIIRNEKSNHA